MTSSMACLLKSSQGAVFKGRLRRSLLVVSLCMLFILLWLFCPRISNQVAPIVPSALPLGGIPDMYVRSTGPRVVIFVMSGKIDDALCYSVGSAYLSGLPVVVAGYEMPFAGYLGKFDFVERAIVNADLNPEDVVIVLDSDTVFTGVDINPYLDRFIAQSAATPDKLDALAVRQGRAMAPIIVSTEGGCFAQNMFVGWEDCIPVYNAIAEKVEKYAAAHPEHQLALPFHKAPQDHINSGVVIARVWAYKEFLQKGVNLTVTQIPPLKTRNRWDCDQSIYTALYMDIMNWEVDQDIFSLPLDKRQAARSPYGVRAGFIDLELGNALSLSTLVYVLYQNELHDELWMRYLPIGQSNHSHSENITKFRDMYRFVSGLHKKAYAAHGEKIYTKLAVPKWVGGRRTSNGTHINLTPPLLAPKLRPIDTVNNTTRHTFPVILHAQGRVPGYTKVKHMEEFSVGARWFIPMVHNPRVKKQAMVYLASTPLFLGAHSYIIRDSYHAKCGFPFEGVIERVKKI